MPMEDGSIYDYIGGAQELMLGANLGISDAVASARVHAAEKAVCVLEDTSEKGQHLVVLVAQYVLFDSLFCQSREGWIRIAPLVQFVD